MKWIKKGKINSQFLKKSIKPMGSCENAMFCTAGHYVSCPSNFCPHKQHWKN